LIESYVILQTIGTWWTLLYTDQDNSRANMYTWIYYWQRQKG